MNQNIRFSYSNKIILLICIFALCLIGATVLMNIISNLLAGKGVLSYDINILSQNLILFALPAASCAFLFSRKPTSFLNLSNQTSWQAVAFLLFLFVTMTPGFNYLVDWNSNIHLPESMQSIEHALKEAEDNAQSVTTMLLNENNIFFSILLVGVLTGFCEELFFRGLLQKQLFQRPMNIHLAIWSAGFIFSLLHFQFFGFFPRWILGSLFGYLVYWSGSLWTAVIAHALNNSMVIVGNEIKNLYGTNIDNIGIPNSGQFPWLALLSLIASIVIIAIFTKYIKKAGRPYSDPASIDIDNSVK